MKTLIIILEIHKTLINRVLPPFITWIIFSYWAYVFVIVGIRTAFRNPEESRLLMQGDTVLELTIFIQSSIVTLIMGGLLLAAYIAIQFIVKLYATKKQKRETQQITRLKGDPDYLLALSDELDIPYEHLLNIRDKYQALEEK